jgi:hypothetical protein
MVSKSIKWYWQVKKFLSILIKESRSIASMHQSSSSFVYFFVSGNFAHSAHSLTLLLLTHQFELIEWVDDHYFPFLRLVESYEWVTWVWRSWATVSCSTRERDEKSPGFYNDNDKPQQNFITKTTEQQSKATTIFRSFSWTTKWRQTPQLTSFWSV